MQFDRRKTILSPSGAKVNLYASFPEDRPRAIVQINHGLAEHAARYAGFARFLAGRGFASYAHDHRGHGYTKAPGATPGSFGQGASCEELVLADIAAIHDLIAQEHAGVPVVVFGHSMGALLAMNFVLLHPDRIAGAAIWNGNFSTGASARAAQAILAWERFRLGSDMPSRLLPKLTFRAWERQVGDGRTPFDWLSRDRAQVDLYVADPLCGWNATVGLWQAIFRLIFAGTDERKIAALRRNLPFHLVGGADDPATAFGKAVEDLTGRLRRMGFSNLVSTVYPETRHESLNELNRDLIMRDFTDWMETILPHSGPSRSA